MIDRHSLIERGAVMIAKHGNIVIIACADGRIYGVKGDHIVKVRSEILNHKSTLHFFQKEAR